MKLKHKKMVKYNIFKLINKEDIPNKGTKLMNFTLTMKQKIRRVYLDRLDISGF